MILRVLSRTRSTGSTLPWEPCSSQVRCSQRWQDVNSTGDPSVRLIAMRVTRSLPQARQPAPVRAPRWVRDPSGTWVRAAVLERAMWVSNSGREAREEDREDGGNVD